jgi:DNA-binding protein HU-beta
MNKSELIDAIAEKGEYLRLMLVRHSMRIASITEALKSGDTVTLVGFGTLALKNVLHVLVVILKLVKSSN